VLRVLFLYTLYASANDLFTFFYLLPRPDSSEIYHFFTSLFTIVEFLLFAGILYILILGRLRRLLVIVGSIGFVIYCVAEYLNSFKTPAFDSLPASIEAILLIIFCILFFFEQLTKPPTVAIYKSNRFWIVFGIMVYTSLSFFLFLQSYITPLQVFNGYWDINLVSNILKNIIFAIAFVIKEETPLNQSNFRTTNLYKP